MVNRQGVSGEFREVVLNDSGTNIQNNAQKGEYPDGKTNYKIRCISNY
jgi:hypothetical protein